MKLTSVLLGLLLSTAAVAQAPVEALIAEDYTCGQLQANLEQEKKLRVDSRGWWGTADVVLEGQQCLQGKRPEAAYVRAADGWCRLGYACVRAP